ncbi:hypothetical protein [[Flexibacter] sp. ATCC 35208]|uniref:hypothetical protein n=1 Tax=[Flexibacter] sp. ATCC 35208 TaxID=1936242 RepID=UPI001C6FC84E|nr:hypothetical protein [[Flexibacter] sp. ATCC 35208]
MTNYQTPDVYTEEVATMPPSVAGVSTAIPVFIDYTEKAVWNGKNIYNTAVPIATLMEFKEYFGGADTTSFTVSLLPDESIQDITVTAPRNTLYYSMDL